MIEYLQRKKYPLEAQLGTIIMLVEYVTIIAAEHLAEMNNMFAFFLIRC